MAKNHLLRTVALFGCAGLMLSGCASLKPEAEQKFWRGKLSVQQPLQEPVSVRFELLQASPELDQWLILSPIGTRLAQLDVHPNRVCAQISTKARQCYNDAETLLQEQLGFHIPLRALPDWLQARCHALMPCHKASESSDTFKLEQGAWIIRVVKWDAQNQPKLIRIEHRQNEQSNLFVSVAIQDHRHGLH